MFINDEIIIHTNGNGPCKNSLKETLEALAKYADKFFAVNKYPFKEILIK